MNRFIKTLLLWLLLAALPLQGVSAAIKSACGPMEHHGSAEMTMSSQSHHHDGDAMEMPDTNVASGSADINSAKSVDQPFGDKHKHSTCSACATCCVGAVAPPSVAVMTSAYSSALPSVVTPTPLVTGFIPAGLERPPKRVTA